MNESESVTDDYDVIDCSDIRGTNAYLDAAAKEELRRRILPYDAKGIHIIASGNYHYLSLLWMEKIKEDFVLVLFDHHTDLMSPTFGELTSCGGWVREALITLDNLRRVYIIGPDENDIRRDICDIPMRERVCLGMPESESLSVYISIDTDILSPAFAACDWDQGDMELFSLKGLLSECVYNYNVIGADICGAKSEPSDSERALNILTEREIISVLGDIL